MDGAKFPQSKDALRKEVMLFESPYTDIAIQSCHYEKKSSITGINEPFGQIVFEYQGTSDNYLDLAQSYLYVSGKVVKADGTAATSNDDYSVTNLFLHSLFENVTLSLNGTEVENAGSNYPWLAYNKILLGNGQGTKTSELTSQLFYKDSDPKTAAVSNEGYKNRKALVTTSAHLEMCGKLQLDIMQSTKYIPNGVSLTLKLTKSAPEFYLWTPAEPATGDPIPFKFKFDEVYLVLKKLSLNPSVITKNEAQLKRGTPMRIPLRKTEIRTFTIPTGSFNFATENLFNGRLPERVFVSFIDASAYSGKISENPFNYKHYDLEFIKTVVEEKTNYSSEIAVDFANNRFLEGYMSLFGAVKPGEDGNFIDRTEYGKDGNVIFSFEILCPTSMDALVPQRNGEVKILAKFRKALTAPTTAIIMGVFANMITIDEKRKVKSLL